MHDECLAGRNIVPTQTGGDWAQFLEPCQRPANEHLIIEGLTENATGNMLAICTHHRELLQAMGAIPQDPQGWL